MRIRKIQIKNETLELNISATSDDGTMSNVLALCGCNGSGKSTLLEFATAAFRSLSATANSNDAVWNRIVCDTSTRGYCEFETSRGIYSVAVENGKILRHDHSHTVNMASGTIEDGFLAYDPLVCRDFLGRKNRDIGAIYARLILKDLYLGRIRNSVIWIDDIDLGWDDSNATELVRHTVRRGAEGDNQVIMSAKNDICFRGLRSSNLRTLALERTSSSIDRILEDVMRLRQR